MALMCVEHQSTDCVGCVADLKSKLAAVEKERGELLLTLNVVAEKERAERLAAEKERDEVCKVLYASRMSVDDLIRERDAEKARADKAEEELRRVTEEWKAACEHAYSLIEQRQEARAARDRAEAETREVRTDAIGWKARFLAEEQEKYRLREALERVGIVASDLERIVGPALAAGNEAPKTAVVTFPAGRCVLPGPITVSGPVTIKTSAKEAIGVESPLLERPEVSAPTKQFEAVPPPDLSRFVTWDAIIEATEDAWDAPATEHPLMRLKRAFEAKAKGEGGERE